MVMSHFPRDARVETVAYKHACGIKRRAPYVNGRTSFRMAYFTLATQISFSVCVDHLKDEADDEAYTGDIRQRVTPHTLVIVMGDRFAHGSPR